jgi:CRISPR-associated endonuclease/helicase Cas3
VNPQSGVEFAAFFRCLTAGKRAETGKSPYPYQARFAAALPEIVDIPTGLGKTEAVVAAWLWALAERRPGAARRLVYSLPMRSLVEQTADRIAGMLAHAEAAGFQAAPKLHIVMGGDVGDDWFENPEHPAAIVGTQDLLLSRALNRGYAMSRFQWPMTFGAINNDVLWVIDEVQLQGVGAVTSAQLQGLREKLGTIGAARTVFMSATLDRDWLDTVDHRLEGRATLSLAADDRGCEPVRRVVDAPKTIRRVVAQDEETVARALREHHRPGRLTLAVVNTVERARSVHRALAKMALPAQLVLLHSRFRAADRKDHIDALFAPIDTDGPGRIVISTQVVEAGIDVDAATLMTDVAPWSSIVQRFGRCNRRGNYDDAVCYWIDAGEPTTNSARPYELIEITQARDMLSNLEGCSGNGSTLPKVAIPPPSGLVLRRVDLLDLFDTSSDLSGHDVDVSRFIREADDFTVSVFWRDDPPTDGEPPHREELCPASIGDVKKLIKRLAERGHGRSARVANQFGSPDATDRPAWISIDERSVRPGLQIWLKSDVGWYVPESGFGDWKGRVEPVALAASASGFREECTTTEGDHGSQIGAAVTLSRHAIDTADEARDIVSSLIDTMSEPLARCTVRAALWHDVGKAHEVFQDTMRRGNGSDAPAGDYWAKCRKGARHKRPGFRHELASALAYINGNVAEKELSLIAYLVASHHGKLRCTPQPLPSDATGSSLLGNKNGDVVPAVRLGDADISPEFRIDLSAFAVGSAGDMPTWVDRVMELRDDPDLGPFRLGYLELLVRIADWRASSRAAERAGVPA